MSACTLKSPSSVCLLLKDQRVNVNELDNGGHTPLWWAARYGSLDVIKLWIASGREMDLGKPGDIDKTDAIGVAKEVGNTEVVTLLERFKSDPAKTRSETALFLACEKGSAEIVEKMLKVEGIDVNRGGGWYTPAPLFAACEGNHFDIIDMLIGHPGIDVNAGDRNGKTPLLLACKKGCAEIVEKLLRVVGIDVNKGEPSPLSAAYEHRRPDVINMLLADHRVRVDATNSRNMSPFFLARDRGDSAFLARLLQHPSSRAVQLFIACEKGKNDIVTQLLAEMGQVGIDVNLCSPQGKTPLLLACEKGYAEIVEKLLKVGGIDVNNGKPSPLFAAFEGNHIEIVDMLIGHPGIDVNMSDRNGNSPLFTACERGLDKVVEKLLRVEGIDVNKKNSGGGTPFGVACCDGRTSCVRLLLKDARVNVNVNDNFGSTALQEAASNGRIDIIRWWIASGRRMDDIEFAIIEGRWQNDTVTLLERFQQSRPQTRAEMRAELGISGESPHPWPTFCPSLLIAFYIRPLQSNQRRRFGPDASNPFGKNSHRIFLGG